MKTRDLISQMDNAEDFDEWLEKCRSEMVELDYTAYLEHLMERYGLTKRELIERANLERGYAYQIFRGERLPSRDRLLQLAIGVGASIEETQRLLKLAGKSELYPRVRRDAALLFCRGKGLSLIDTQLFLEGKDLPLLKE